MMREKNWKKILDNNHLVFEEKESVKEWQDKILELLKPYVELVDLNIKFNYLNPTPLCSIMSKYKSYKGNENIESSWHNYTNFIL